jgi:hypothetical protein
MRPGGRLVHADIVGRCGRVTAARFARRCRSAGDLGIGFGASQQLVRDRAALLIIWVALLALFRIRAEERATPLAAANPAAAIRPLAQAAVSR